MDVLPIFKKTKSTNSDFVSNTQKNEPYIYVGVFSGNSDRIEVRVVVNIPSPTFGDQHFFL